MIYEIFHDLSSSTGVRFVGVATVGAVSLSLSLSLSAHVNEH